MWLKYIIIGVLFFVFAIIQSSFLPHLAIFNLVPNIVFIFFFILIFFEKNESQTSLWERWPAGIFLIVAGGWALDLFSPSRFGSAILSLLLIYAMVKITLHFLKERNDALSMVYFVTIFIISFMVYQVIFNLISGISYGVITFNRYFLMSIFYNLAIALAGFFLYNYIVIGRPKNRQLNLFA
jgi:hypothetical protein